MKALVWHGTTDIRCDTVPDPKIEDDRDAIIKVTSCAICGSDLHLYDHFMPGMKSGDIMGHETMGEVVEVGSGAKHKLKVGERVVIPFTIICGECEQCRRGNFSVCERTNRNKATGRRRVRAHHSRAVRLHAPDRRLSGRPGRISARAVRRRDAHQGAGRHPRRQAAVPQRHPADRLAGRRAMRHPADRYGRGVGLRPGRADGDPQRDPVGREAGHRDRPAARAPVDGRGGRRDHDQFRGGKHRRAPQRADRRQGTRRNASTRSGWRRTRPPRSTRCTTAPSRR